MNETSNDRINKKPTALITGVSKGIGRTLALWLSEQGYHIIGIGRVLSALEQLDDEIRALGGSFTLIQANLTSDEKVMALGPAILERFGKIDLLISSGASTGPLSPLGHIKMKDWQNLLDINLSANLSLIQMADPLLSLSERPCAIFLTSNQADTPKPYWAAYNASKAGLNALVRTYTKERADGPLRIYLVDPGPTDTSHRQKNYPGEDKQKQKAATSLLPLFKKIIFTNTYPTGELISYDETNKKQSTGH